MNRTPNGTPRVLKAPPHRWNGSETVENGKNNSVKKLETVGDDRHSSNTFSPIDTYHTADSQSRKSTRLTARPMWYAQRGLVKTETPQRGLPCTAHPLPKSIRRWLDQKARTRSIDTYMIHNRTSEPLTHHTHNKTATGTTIQHTARE